jgi:uncharacterized membrane protein YkoI
MKKTIVTIVSAVVIVAAIITVSVIASAKNAQKNAISSKKALSIALEDAGVTEDNANDVSSVFELHNGMYVFEVEFKSKGNEYEYHIDAKSGEIVDRDVESDDDYIEESQKIELTTENKEASTEKAVEPEIQDNNDIPQTTAKKSATKKDNSSDDTKSSYIGLSKAKSTALSDAGVSSSSATFTEARFDWDDGVPTYDIDFRTSTKKYEYDIHATTGKILDKEVETIRSKPAPTPKPTPAPTPKPTPAPSKNISVTKAKSIALSHAGLSASQVKFTKAKLEYDDGRYEYDIEFKYGNKEYEYEISAKTGKIIDYDVDYDDDYDD